MDFQLRILQFFQSIRSEILSAIFLVFTISTELPIIVLFSASMYWCLNKTYGQRILFSLIGNININTGIKEFIKSPRPIGTPGLESMRVSTATGYSFPSGHTQTATAFWVSIIDSFRKKWITILGTIIILGVGISRLYLAVHWPIDVIFGWIFGVIFTILFSKIFDYVHKSKKYSILLFVLAIASIISFLLNSESYIEVFALLTGFVLGYIVEDKFIKFETDYNIKVKFNFGSKRKKKNRSRLMRNIYRFLIGITTLGILYLVLKYIMPNNDMFNYIRYTTVVFYGIAGVPAIFKLLSLD